MVEFALTGTPIFFLFTDTPTLTTCPDVAPSSTKRMSQDLIIGSFVRTLRISQDPSTIEDTRRSGIGILHDSIFVYWVRLPETTHTHCFVPSRHSVT